MSAPAPLMWTLAHPNGVADPRLGTTDIGDVPSKDIWIPQFSYEPYLRFRACCQILRKKYFLGQTDSYFPSYLQKYRVYGIETATVLEHSYQNVFISLKLTSAKYILIKSTNPHFGVEVNFLWNTWQPFGFPSVPPPPPAILSPQLDATDSRLACLLKRFAKQRSSGPILVSNELRDSVPPLAYLVDRVYGIFSRGNCRFQWFCFFNGVVKKRLWRLVNSSSRPQASRPVANTATICHYGETRRRWIWTRWFWLTCWRRRTSRSSCTSSRHTTRWWTRFTSRCRNKTGPSAAREARLFFKYSCFKYWHFEYYLLADILLLCFSTVNKVVLGLKWTVVDNIKSLRLTLTFES